MYEKKVECESLALAMAGKNVSSDENRIFSIGVESYIRVRDYFLPAESESGCEE